MAISLKESILLIETPRAPREGHRCIVSNNKGLDSNKCLLIASEIRDEKFSGAHISVRYPAEQSETGRRGLEIISLLGPAAEYAQRLKRTDAVKTDLLSYSRKIDQLIQKDINWTKFAVVRPELNDWLDELVTTHKLQRPTSSKFMSTAQYIITILCIISVALFVYRNNDRDRADEKNKPSVTAENFIDQDKNPSKFTKSENYIATSCNLENDEIIELRQEYKRYTGHNEIDLDYKSFDKAIFDLSFIKLRSQKRTDLLSNFEAFFPSRTDISTFCKTNYNLNIIAGAIQNAAPALAIILSESTILRRKDTEDFANFVQDLQRRLPETNSGFRSTPLLNQRALVVYSAISQHEKDLVRWFSQPHLLKELAEASVRHEIRHAPNMKLSRALKEFIAVVLVLRTKPRDVLNQF